MVTKLLVSLIVVFINFSLRAQRVDVRDTLVQVQEDVKPYTLEVNGLAMPCSPEALLRRFGEPDSIEVYENVIGWYTELDDSIREYNYNGASFAVYKNDNGKQEATVDEVNFRGTRWTMMIGKDTLTSRTRLSTILKHFRHHIYAREGAGLWLNTVSTGFSDDQYLLTFHNGRLDHFYYVYPD